MKQPTNELLFLICSSSLISFSSLSFSSTAEFSMLPLPLPLKQPTNGFVQHHPADPLHHRQMGSQSDFFFRNGVFSASASIDAHGRFIKKRSGGFSLQVSAVSPAA
jgi:hypothetical protein